MRRDMVSPIWEGVTLIPDEITQAKKGEIVITAVLLHAVKTRSLGRFPSNSKFKPRERLSAMPGILLSGPAGGGKSQAARDLLRAASEPTVAADFQAIVAALAATGTRTRRQVPHPAGLGATACRVRSPSGYHRRE